MQKSFATVPDEMLTVPDVAAMLQKSRGWVYAAARSGKIPSRMVGGGRRFVAAEVIAAYWVDSAPASAAGGPPTNDASLRRVAELFGEVEELVDLVESLHLETDGARAIGFRQADGAWHELGSFDAGNYLVHQVLKHIDDYCGICEDRMGSEE